MARRAEDFPSGSVVVANPDENCSPSAFRALLNELAAGPEPVIDSLEAGEVLAQMRADAEHE